MGGAPPGAPPWPERPTWFDRLAWRRLVRQGFVERRAERWVLTARGRRAGQELVRAHRLWEAYLEERLRLPPDHLHEPAERLEHYLGPELQARLSEELGGTRRDPHGREIPELPPGQ
jgi:Mn-dependent DtxR family transcriptional regulator